MVVYCSVDSCYNEAGGQYSFFRVPKDPARCYVWKQNMGMVGKHRYANLSPEESFTRIKICSIHFEDNHFANKSKSRIKYDAIPTLRLVPPNKDVSDAASVSSLTSTNETCKMSTQTHFGQLLGTTYSDNSKPIATYTSKRSQAIQTNTHLSANTPRKRKLKQQVKYLEKQLRESSSSREQNRVLNFQDVLKYVDKYYQKEFGRFLKSELTLLSRAPNCARFTTEFFQFALAVYFLGPNVYDKLQTLCILPTKNELLKQTKHWVIPGGFSDFLLKALEFRVRLLEPFAQDCIISMEEIPIKSSLFYDISHDNIIGFETSGNSLGVANSAILIMAKGMVKKWCIPITYYFLTNSTSSQLKAILFESIRKLTQIELNVIGVVSSHEEIFCLLAENELNLSPDNPSFVVDQSTLFYFFDIPNLVKSTRNMFFDHWFILGDDILKKEYIEKLYELEKHKQYKLASKLTMEHIYSENLKKQPVQFAAEIFSHSIAVALHTYVDCGILPPEAKATAEFIKNVHDFLDIMSSQQNFSVSFAREYEIRFIRQVGFIFKNLRIVTRDEKDLIDFMNFIYGWELTISSYLRLFEHINSKTYTFIPEANVSTDGFARILDQLKSIDGSIHTPIKFHRTFRKVFVSMYFEHMEGARCFEEMHYILKRTSPELLNICKNLLSISKTSVVKLNSTDYRHTEKLKENNCMSLVEFLMNSCLNIHSCKLCQDFIEGQTFQSSSTSSSGCFLDFIISLENSFLKTFSAQANNAAIADILIKELSKISFTHPCPTFPRNYCILLFIRIRIYYTLKHSNKHFRIQRKNRTIPEFSVIKMNPLNLFI